MSVYRKDFTHSVKEKVMVMINQKINQLEIRLDPAELGSMHVKVNLQNEQAVVSFVVQNSQTKDVLEQNIGKLKEMLADSGIDVGESNIEQQDNSADESAEFAQQQQTNEHEQQALASEESEQMSTNLYKASSTGIDYFA
jgi:flagellar hook-length control protein FliK